jgi:hypothetical protein
MLMLKSSNKLIISQDHMTFTAPICPWGRKLKLAELLHWGVCFYGAVFYILGKTMKSHVISAVETSQLMVDHAVYNTMKRWVTVSDCVHHDVLLQLRH